MARVIHADPPPAAVVPCDVIDAHRTAEGVIRRAQAAAADIAAAARAEGLARGRAEVGALLLQAGRSRDAMLRDAQGQVVQVAAAMASRIVGEAFERDPRHMQQLAAGLLSKVRQATRVRLTVHPDDAKVLRAAIAQASEDGAMPACLSIEPDASMSRGDCRVDSDLGELDARVETRVQALVQALAGPLP